MPLDLGCHVGAEESAQEAVVVRGEHDESSLIGAALGGTSASPGEL